MKVTIFYSWQSDLPNSTNRGLIQRALEKAVESIKSQEELVIDPCVERDTAGVPGSPDIASTIFRKIDACHIFVGDVSIINPKTRNGRKTPNPNVLLELGYASKSLTWDNVICVFNSAFGRTEDLPFDLRLRRMALYSVSEDQEVKADERDKLSSLLRAALQPILLRLNQEVKEEQAPKPITPDEATSIVKGYLADDRHRIQLSDFVMNVGNELVSNVISPNYPVQMPSINLESVVIERIKQFADLTQKALSTVIAGCYWGTQAQNKLWVDLIQRVANHAGEPSGLMALFKLRKYPALLIFNAGCLAAVAAENYGTLLALLTTPKITDFESRGDESPLIQFSSQRWLDKDYFKQLMKQRWYAPYSEHLFISLREPLRSILSDERGYERCFDRYEYLRSLFEADVFGGPVTIGRFGWRWKYPETDVMKALEVEEEQLKEKWPLYQHGFFQGSRDRFRAAKNKVDGFVAKLCWN